MNFKYFAFLLFLLTSITSCGNKNTSDLNTNKVLETPRIINIINFIRQTDYRVEDADRLMFETVENQINLVNEYDFPATFLFQYDALINPAYQELMKTHLKPNCEIGAWWEITQPHVEEAGIEWRGEHRWVSHANIAFSTGYTPEERKILVDVYMSKFKEIYGKYPKSVGSWFIDSHTLLYMYEKYNIVASSNCKDQVGTDGYTLWGGYWNQGYYPSRKNAYMPAQTEQGQIPVPIFRMLGSDPIYQYDNGIGGNRQGVISLEPVYHDSGMNKEWVEYFFKSIVNEPSLAFNYAQAGQENSFTWENMKDGLNTQFPIMDSLRKSGKIRIETLQNTGEWFKENFPTTPATAVTTLVDIKDQNKKTVWYNSRFYRSNILWEEDSFCFRDIHLFNEDIESEYLNKPGFGNQFFYYTLPLVDRFNWSTNEEYSGLKFQSVDINGDKSYIVLTNPIINEIDETTLRVESKDEIGNNFIVTFYEDNIDIFCDPKDANFNWQLALNVPKENINKLPFKTINKSHLHSEFRGNSYEIECNRGVFTEGNVNTVFEIIPENNKIIINGKVKIK